MKAKIKPSGRIAEIESLRIKGSNRTYYPQELDILPIEKDWQQVRIQFISAALNGLTSNSNFEQHTLEDVVAECITLADTLIAELQKKGEEDGQDTNT